MTTKGGILDSTAMTMSVTPSHQVRRVYRNIDSETRRANLRTTCVLANVCGRQILATLGTVSAKSPTVISNFNGLNVMFDAPGERPLGGRENART